MSEAKGKMPRYIVITVIKGMNKFDVFANSIAGAINDAADHGYTMIWADRKDQGSFMAIATREPQPEDFLGDEPTEEVATGTEGEGVVRDLREDGDSSEQMSLPLGLPDSASLAVPQESRIIVP